MWTASSPPGRQGYRGPRPPGRALPWGTARCGRGSGTRGGAVPALRPPRRFVRDRSGSTPAGSLAQPYALGTNLNESYIQTIVGQKRYQVPYPTKVCGRSERRVAESILENSRGLTPDARRRERWRPWARSTPPPTWDSSSGRSPEGFWPGGCEVGLRRFAPVVTVLALIWLAGDATRPQAEAS